jgi:hypothetical protein
MISRPLFDLQPVSAWRLGRKQPDDIDLVGNRRFESKERSADHSFRAEVHPVFIIEIFHDLAICIEEDNLRARFTVILAGYVNLTAVLGGELPVMGFQAAFDPASR